MKSLEIHLLGTFRVAIDGEVVPDARWRQRKPALLLQRLAVEPHHRMHVEQLMELLWPEADADAARNRLHKTIHMVRSALEPELERAASSHFLLTQGQQLVLSAPGELWIDVEAFQSAAAEAIRSEDPAAFESAIALYEGPLLPADPYEEWIVERREQLAETYQQLLLDLARIHETRSDYDRATEVLHRLVTSDPANEAAHRALMRLYAATGRRQLALRQYRECTDALRRELDADPDAATAELYEQIVAGHVKPQPARALRLAVLPFANATGDPELDYLSDGMTEGIIGSLTRLPRLHVMAHSTVSRHAAHDADPLAVARELNVSSIVTGKMMQRGDRLIVRAELIDATDGSRVWGDEFVRGSDDVLHVQEEISAAIADQFGLRGSTQRHTKNSEAYQLFLRGRYLWNRRTVDAVTRSLDYFRRAIELDPDYAMAWIGLADSYTKLGDVGVSVNPPREAFGKAKIAAIRAVGLDSSLAEAHTTLAHLFMHEYEWSEAEREYRVSLRLNPNDATTHDWFAYQLMMTGRPSEGMAEIERALELDPLSLPVNADYGELLYYARDYGAALEQYQKANELDPHFYPIHLGIGRVLLELGRHEEAIAAFEKALELSGGSTDAIAALARGQAMSGNRDAARDRLAQLEETSKSRYVSAYAIAAVHAALGNTDSAFTWLQRACDEHAAWSIYISVDPRLDPLRADPRFARILDTVGLGSVHAGSAI